jgi:hypothetical protein
MQPLPRCRAQQRALLAWHTIQTLTLCFDWCPYCCACRCCQIAVNNDITDVWYFWDTHKMFADWAGVLSKLDMSSAALVTGWVSAVLLAGSNKMTVSCHICSADCRT